MKRKELCMSHWSSIVDVCKLMALKGLWNDRYGSMTKWRKKKHWKSFEFRRNQQNSSEWLFCECWFQNDFDHIDTVRTIFHWILKRFNGHGILSLPFTLVPRYRWTDDNLWARLDFISVILAARVINLIGCVLENAVAQWKFPLCTQ